MQRDELMYAFGKFIEGEIQAARVTLDDEAEDRYLDALALAEMFRGGDWTKGVEFY